MTPEQLAYRNQRIAEGQRLAWRKPEVRARRIAAITRAWDDPLKRALARAQQEARTASPSHDGAAP